MPLHPVLTRATNRSDGANVIYLLGSSAVKRSAYLLSSLAFTGLVMSPPVETQEIANEYRQVADRLIDALTENHDAYERLTALVDRFGHRVSGSVALEQAIDWIMDEMQADGLENVRGETVMVPHWVRGEESLQMILPLSLIHI